MRFGIVCHASYSSLIHQYLGIVADLGRHIVTINKHSTRVGSDVVHQTRAAARGGVLVDGPPIHLAVHGEGRLAPDGGFGHMGFPSENADTLAWVLNERTHRTKIQCGTRGERVCAMNGGETLSTTGKETVSKNVFPGTQGLSFPPTKVMYVLDVVHDVLVRAYILIPLFHATGEEDSKKLTVKYRIRRDAP